MNKLEEGEGADVAEPIIDDENPEWTEADFAAATGPEELPPEVLAAFPKTAARGSTRDPSHDEDVATILSGLAEVVAIENGTADPSTYRVHVSASVDVRAMRKGQNLTQAGFAAR